MEELATADWRICGKVPKSKAVISSHTPYRECLNQVWTSHVHELKAVYGCKLEEPSQSLLGWQEVKTNLELVRDAISRFDWRRPLMRPYENAAKLDLSDSALSTELGLAELVSGIHENRLGKLKVSDNYIAAGKKGHFI